MSQTPDRTKEAELQRALGRPEPRPRTRRRVRTRSVVASSVVLAVLVAPLAVAQSGSDIRLGARNPSSGSGAPRETAIVANIANNGQSTRQSNNAKGGRAAGYGCDNDGQAEVNACANYVNRGLGPAAAFRTRGQVPFVIRDTNRGRVANLNADLLDDKDSTDFLGKTEQAADSARLQGRAANEFLGRTEQAADSARLQGLTPDQIGRELWAVVRAGIPPTLQRGNGATEAIRVNAGNYRVQFNRDVSACSYQVSGANVGENLIGTADADNTNAQRVFVSLRDPATSNRTDGDFNLAVLC